MLSVLPVAFTFYRYFSDSTDPIGDLLNVIYTSLISFILLSLRISLIVINPFSKIILAFSVLAILFSTLLYLNTALVTNYWNYLFTLIFSQLCLTLYNFLEKEHPVHKYSAYALLITLAFLLIISVGNIGNHRFYSVALSLITISTLMTLTAFVFFRKRD